MTPLIYRSPLLYQSVMRLLHGRYFEDPYRTVAAHVPDGASVVELCAGDARLYTHHLRQKKVDYLGLDLSPAFVAAARRKAIPFRQHDLFQDAIPPADIVLIQAALYTFYAQAEQVIQQMLAAASAKVIVTEPIVNLSTSPSRSVAWVSRILTGTHNADSSAPPRFDESALRQLFSQFPTLQTVQIDPSGREMTGVFVPTRIPARV